MTVLAVRLATDTVAPQLQVCSMVMVAASPLKAGCGHARVTLPDAVTLAGPGAAGIRVTVLGDVKLAAPKGQWPAG